MEKQNEISLNIGDYTLIVSKAHEVHGHDDSLPYNANFEVFKNNKLYVSGRAWNDGWGGTSVVEPNNVEDNDKLIEFDNLCKKTIVFKWHDREIPLGIDDTIDILAELLIFHKDKVNGHLYTSKEINFYLSQP